MVLSRRGVVSLAFLGGALVFGVVLGLVLAFGSSEPDPWEEHWADLGVPEAEFVFLGDLTKREQESIRRELRVAQVVFAEHFGAVTSDFTVYVSTELDALNEQLVEFEGEKIRFTCGGRAFKGAVFLTLEGCARELRLFGGPLAHEYFHILQYEAGLPESSDHWLLWLVEGSAEYAGALVDEAQGRRTLATLRQGKQLAWSAGRLERTWYSYDYGFLATDWLMEGVGTEAVLEFFRLGGNQTAFESAFGMPLGVFRSSFEAYGRVAVPPFDWRVGGTVLGSDSVPVEGVYLVTLVRIEGEAWAAGIGETDAIGGFEFAAPESGYTLGLVLRCPSDKNVLQLVHVGEWGAEGFVAVDQWIWGGGRGEAEPFTDGDRDRTELIIRLPTTLAELTAKHCKA